MTRRLHFCLKQIVNFQLHGFRADKLIERLGLGIDGNHKERKVEQQIRDDGHLQGLNYFTP
jgi:hypothetical protein